MAKVFELLIAALLAGMILSVRRIFSPIPALAPTARLAVSGDEDMKIADGSFSSAPRPDVSDAEAEARAYMLQKSAGNVDKARELGKQFARALMEGAAGELLEQKDTPEALREHHRLVLYSHVVNRVIADLSPNSILAQTALNVFYNELEEAAPLLAEHIRDMAAFSLYILCERSETCVEDEIGKIFAKLCGEEGNRKREEEGNLLYRQYYDACCRLHEQTDYARV